MSAREITWTASLVARSELDSIKSMALALGFATIAKSESQVMLQTSRGDVLEYCTPDHMAPDYLFHKQAVVIGFRVDDLDTTIRELSAAGFATIGTGGRTGTIRFHHFTGPGSVIYGLICDEDRREGRAHSESLSTT